MLDNTNENGYHFHIVMNKALSGPARHKRENRSGTDTVAHMTSGELLGPYGELIIVHDGREYRLRLTQNGKLILTA